MLNYHMWTKKEMKKLILLWDTKSVQDIADELKCTAKSVKYMSSQLRKKGIPLTNKRKITIQQLLIDELLEDEDIKAFINSKK